MPPITSTANAHARHLRALRGAHRRERAGLVLLEGIRLCADALAGGFSPTTILYDPDHLGRSERGQALAAALPAMGAVPATAAVLDSIGDTRTSQGVIMAGPEPSAKWPDAPGPVVLLLDQVRDPGNLGTILRSAAACGLVRVVVTLDCADPWATKALRAGMGAHFRLVVDASSTLDSVLDLTIGRPIWVATASGATSYWDADWRRDCVLAIGGEAEGPGAQTLAHATGTVAIPLAAGAESLNAGVAAGILMFEAARRRGGR